MKHEMRLHNEPFEKIKKGTKTIEMRLYDEKRQLFQKNDYIELTNRVTGEKLLVQIEDLFIYPSFQDLYQQFDKESLGYDEEEEAKPEDLEQYYSKEEQEQYGVVGIKIKKVD